MSPAHRLLPLLLLCAGCKLLAKDDSPPADEAKAEAKEEEVVEEGGSAAPAQEVGHAAPAPGSRYGVPFAWERSPEEPLAKARQFMADVLKDNAAFSGQSRERFKALSEAERPRATVLTCSDSRVQPGAWDATPENDSYTVRDLGNQLATALGSVEYGVEVLRTPVLLVIGHTGCDAVASALSGSPKREGAIADELSHIARPGKARGKESGHALTEAVIHNVNAQVTDAVSRFAPRVQSGDLTVIGAVYDVVNDLGKGAGRLQLVNVNGNVEPTRIKAFEEAVNEQNTKAALAAAKRSSPDERARGLLDGSMRLPPGSRATINAVNVVGTGGMDAVEGALRHELSRGTPHDVRPVPRRAAPAAATGHDAEASASASGEASGHADAHDAHGVAPGKPEAHGKPEPAKAEAHGKPEPAKTEAHGKPEPAKTEAHGKPEPAKTEAGKAEAHGKPEPAKTEAGKAEAHAKTEPSKTEPDKAEAHGKAEAAKAEAGKAEAGKAEAGKAEAGKAEAGKAEAHAKTESSKAEPSKAEPKGKTEAKAKGKAEAKAKGKGKAEEHGKEPGAQAPAALPWK